MRFVDIVVVLRLDLGQISLQLALLATSIAFYDILARACAEIKILRKAKARHVRLRAAQELMG